MNPRILMAAALLAGCAAQHAQAPVAAAAGEKPHAAHAVDEVGGVSAEVLPFIDNDYDGALAQAKAKGLPLFVDVWAPW